MASTGIDNDLQDSRSMSIALSQAQRASVPVAPHAIVSRGSLAYSWHNKKTVIGNIHHATEKFIVNGVAG